MEAGGKVWWAGWIGVAGVGGGVVGWSEVLGAWVEGWWGGVIGGGGGGVGGGGWSKVLWAWMSGWVRVWAVACWAVWPWRSMVASMGRRVWVLVRVRVRVLRAMDAEPARAGVVCFWSPVAKEMVGVSISRRRLVALWWAW